MPLSSFRSFFRFPRLPLIYPHTALPLRPSRLLALQQALEKCAPNVCVNVRTCWSEQLRIFSGKRVDMSIFVLCVCKVGSTPCNFFYLLHLLLVRLYDVTSVKLWAKAKAHQLSCMSGYAVHIFADCGHDWQCWLGILHHQSLTVTFWHSHLHTKFNMCGTNPVKPLC